MTQKAKQKAVYIQNFISKLERKKVKGGHRFLIEFALPDHSRDWIADMNNLFDGLFKNQLEYFSPINHRGLRLEWDDYTPNPKTETPKLGDSPKEKEE